MARPRRLAALLPCLLAAAWACASSGPGPGPEPELEAAASASTAEPRVSEAEQGAATSPAPSSPPAGPEAPGSEEAGSPGTVSASSDPQAAEDDAWLDDDAWLEEDWLDPGPTPADRDPWEPANRPLHGFNEGVRRWFFQPVTRAYEFVVPEPGRRALGRFFDNLGEPSVFVNHVIQRNPRDAGVTGARFLVNTTLGLVGLFDPAENFGLEARSTDFGQTLATYCVDSGPYLVLPFFGPSTIRDALGGLLDSAMRPDRLLFGTGAEFVTLSAGRGITTYEAQEENLETLRESSVDFYSALRAAYLMHRDAEIAARMERLRRSCEEGSREQMAGPDADGAGGEATSLSPTASEGADADAAGPAASTPAVASPEPGLHPAGSAAADPVTP